MRKDLDSIRRSLLRSDLFETLAMLVADTDIAERRRVAAFSFAKGMGDTLLAEAEKNEISCVLGHFAAAIDPDLARAARWTRAHDDVSSRTSRLLQEAERVAGHLAASGMRIVALKNGGIARGIVGCPGCSPMGDLDLLVSRERFREAHDAMVEMGFEFAFRSKLEEATLENAERSGGSEFYRSFPSGERLWFELQWRAVAGRWIGRDMEPRGDDLLARSLEIPGSSLRLLSPVDNLMQVCLHTAKHSYVRAPGFRLHTDVDRIVRRQEMKWAEFVDLAARLRVKTAVWFSLAIPAAVLGTPVPGDVLSAIRPPEWKVRVLRRMIAGAGLFDPKASKFSRSAYVAFNALLFDDLHGLKESAFGRERVGERGGSEASRGTRLRHLVERVSGLLFRRERT